MSRRLVSLTLDTLEDLPRRCRQCVFWELDPVSAERACVNGDPGLEKEAWVSQTLLEWGSCGKLVYVDGMPAGFALYSPPAYVPRSMAFPTSPISADAVLLMSTHVVPSFAGGGLGRMLIQGIARDVAKRGIRAIEAFGDAKFGDEADETSRCLAPADFFLAVGFKTVRPHPRFPRVRLELRTALSWKSDVEYALEKLLGSMSPETILRPATRAMLSGDALS
jgi:GNAT superfamily N-acetyltransferase